jgi:hypothetical protein
MRDDRSRGLRLVGFCVIASFWCVRLAAAQTSAPRATRSTWEVEIHGGFGSASAPRGGTGQLPPAGIEFLSGSDLRPSRAISSWYFGDGAVLFNQFRAFFPTIPAIVPLDQALQQAGARRKAGATFGFRVSRLLSDRYTAELSVDFLSGTLALTDAFKASAETSRASFLATLNATFPGGGPGVAVSSVAQIQDNRGSRTLTTGVLNLRLTERNGFMTHLTIGVGVESPRGDAPSVTLTGNYRFGTGGTTLDETDALTVRPASRSTFVTVLGGGFKKHISGRSGIRADVRMIIGRNPMIMKLDATPTAGAFSPGVTLRTVTTPSVVFSSQPSQQRSLSGPRLEAFETFSGSGMPFEVIATAGYYFRF